MLKNVILLMSYDFKKCGSTPFEDKGKLIFFQITGCNLLVGCTINLVDF